MPFTNFCDQCDCETDNSENEYGEFICDGCFERSNERAYDRQCGRFYGAGSPVTLKEKRSKSLT